MYDLKLKPKETVTLAWLDALGMGGQFIDLITGVVHASKATKVKVEVANFKDFGQIVELKSYTVDPLVMKQLDFFKLSRRFWRLVFENTSDEVNDITVQTMTVFHETVGFEDVTLVTDTPTKATVSSVEVPEIDYHKIKLSEYSREMLKDRLLRCVLSTGYTFAGLKNISPKLEPSSQKGIYVAKADLVLANDITPYTNKVEFKFGNVELD